jgi:glutathione S-transferase
MRLVVRVDHVRRVAHEREAIGHEGRIPAIVDHDTGIALMESGAILIYLADKTGKQECPLWSPLRAVERDCTSGPIAATHNSICLPRQQKLFACAAVRRQSGRIATARVELADAALQQPQAVARISRPRAKSRKRRALTLTVV